jgi:cation:H+ antiporter
VTVAAAPDIAVGDMLGSCVFNLAILALIDVFYRRGAMYEHAGTSALPAWQSSGST